jgi:serine/threonine-protein kinase
MVDEFDDWIDGLIGAVDKLERAVESIDDEVERSVRDLDPRSRENADAEALVTIAEVLPASTRQALLQNISRSLSPDQRRETAADIVETLPAEQQEEFVESVLEATDADTREEIEEILASEGKKAAVIATLLWLLDKIADVFIQTPVEPVARDSWDWLRRMSSKLLHPLMPDMVTIPAGEFLMGSDPAKYEDARGSEQPQHAVYLPRYRIARYPVTNKQYAAFVRTTDHGCPRHWEDGRIPPDKADHPVVCVSWYQAVAFCEWLSRRTGRNIQLPSEAEWEKAARGTDGRIYPWGNAAPTADLCNFGNNIGTTTSVDRYSPAGDSPYGCADVAGNVWEWTRSLYKDYPYDPDDGREDLGASGSRVFRGGSFGSSESYVRCAVRFGNYPNYRVRILGFRVVVSPFRRAQHGDTSGI